MYVLETVKDNGTRSKETGTLQDLLDKMLDLEGYASIHPLARDEDSEGFIKGVLVLDRGFTRAESRYLYSYPA